MQLFDEAKLLFTGIQYASRGAIGGPERTCLTPVWLLYKTAFVDFNFGFGATLALGLFAVIIVLSLSVFRLITRGGEIEY